MVDAAWNTESEIEVVVEFFSCYLYLFTSSWTNLSELKEFFCDKKDLLESTITYVKAQKKSVLVSFMGAAEWLTLISDTLLSFILPKLAEWMQKQY